jgi:UDPglucose--hexose-1-phosphate uridylyltransferase
VTVLELGKTVNKLNKHQLIADFVETIIQNDCGENEDRVYFANKILGLIGEDELEHAAVSPNLIAPVEIVDGLVDIAERNGTLENRSINREIMEAELMDFITARPSIINREFWHRYGQSPDAATAYFFDLSKKNDYIKTRAIAKNVHYYAPTEFGDMEITINLSKPEKDPKDLAAARHAKTSSYPKCLLCVENEGYLGRLNHPARTNHRIINLDLNGEAWGLQYSPYAYYNEHAIILNADHSPMKISGEGFSRLFEFVRQFPGYMAGSNADLPIVGGSILTHDHYQAGRHEFPMAKANDEFTFALNGFDTIQASIVKWPMSVIRLTGPNANELVEASVKVMNKWKAYSDPSIEVVAESSDGTPHHTVTPIVRKKGTDFQIDLVLRDNNVSDEHPDGIFHPHKDVQHIKKENIGLIEVMGLAILPPRLVDELAQVEAFIIGEDNTLPEMHLAWANELKANYSDEDVTEYVKVALGHKFTRVLEDAGVFKVTPEGRTAFKKFLDFLNK